MLNTKALAASASAAKVYVEDVFSTWLYNGNGSTQTITNGINLSGKGGLTWIKARSSALSHQLFDTARGATKELISNSTAAETTDTDTLTAFNADGFSLGADATTNTSGAALVSWTFRKAAKFFDVVTYTGTGVARTITHNLGSVPGCIIVKQTAGGTANWFVQHRSISISSYLQLDTTDPSTSNTAVWNNTTPTSSVFSVGTNADVNGSGNTYVAYLFAHDAGGFGDSGNDNVISCGSFTTGSSPSLVANLGWEPQWVLIKSTNSTYEWWQYDNMRGAPVDQAANILSPNTSSAESPSGAAFTISNQGIQFTGNVAGISCIYIAIRRGPMKTPTDATNVFQAKVYTGTNVDNRLVTTDILTDMVWARQRNDSVLAGMVVGDRLRGQPYLLTGSTAAEVNDADSFDQQIVSAVEYGTAFSSMSGFYVGNDATSKLNANTTSNNHVVHAFRRAPGFFDAVAYTGTGSGQKVNHNLGVIPELTIIKRRNTTSSFGWYVWSKSVANTTSGKALLNSNGQYFTGDSMWGALPTSTQLTLGIPSDVSASGGTFIAYLFATCPGVSKVGSYTGSGTTKQIDCGFTAGARFVLIKRTDSTGDWYVWDTARGIVSGNDPSLLLNSTAAEVTNTDYIDPLSSGFEISSTAPAAINANGGTYLFLAIA